MTLSRRFLVLMFVALMGLGEGSGFARRLIPVETVPSGDSTMTVEVTDLKGPGAGARVWIETLDGRLLQEALTGPDGRLRLSLPPSFDGGRGAFHVTAYREGHAAVSALENVARLVRLELPVHAEDRYASLQGQVTGFERPEDDEDAMVGLAAKALELGDLTNLDPSFFISPWKDSIDVVGRREIPSNLVLPDQTIPVYFIPIRINKPSYRLPVLAGSSERYFAATGFLNVKKAIEIFSNKGDAWQIMNHVQFARAGISAVVPVPAGADRVNLNLAASQKLDSSIQLRIGRDTSDAKARRLAIALWESSPGVYVPTDVKLADGREVRLSAAEMRSTRVLDVLITDRAERFRGAWVDPQGRTIPDAGLSAKLQATGLDRPWEVSGAADSNLSMAHVEAWQRVSTGGGRFQDLWIAVGPRREVVRLPAVAAAALSGLIARPTHLSVDLLKVRNAGYPFFDAEVGASNLESLEKARVQLAQ